MGITLELNDEFWQNFCKAECLGSRGNSGRLYLLIATHQGYSRDRLLNMATQENIDFSDAEIFLEYGMIRISDGKYYVI